MGRSEHSASRLRGLTLVEVAVAVAILGGVIVGLLLARARAQESYNIANEVMTSTRLCASQVARLRARLVDEGEGVFSQPSGYTWRIARSAAPDVEGAAGGLDVYEIHVIPASGEEAGGASVTLWLLSPATPKGSGP